MQVVEMTHKEKVKMYSRVKKKKLIKMLISCNIALKNLTSARGSKIIETATTDNNI